MKKGIRAR